MVRELDDVRKAIDALEIDPPAPVTALRRTKSALAVIKDVIKRG